MQRLPLTVNRIADYASDWHGQTEVVACDVDGTVVRTTYSDLNHRARRFSAMLRASGVAPGDLVPTLAWNNIRHLEAWYGIMGMGAVCHTLNPRLHLDQLVYIIGHAQNRILITDAGFAPIVEPLVERCPSIERVIVLGETADLSISLRIDTSEALLAEHTEGEDWSGLREGMAAGLCYTSGTTGDPKGVLYSHRANYLHTLMTIQPNMLGLSSTDTVLPLVPMFHANACGLVFSAPAVGAKLVLPGPRLDPCSIYELMEREGVTYAAAVPTLWQMLVDYLDKTGRGLTTLQRISVGGSACPEALIAAMRDRHGLTVLQSWGMTENSPLGIVSTPTAAVAAFSPREQLRMLAKQGRPPLGMELRIIDQTGRRLPHDGLARGRLQIRGNTTLSRYFRRLESALDDDGFFDTGDIASIDQHGYVEILDRAKDLIKSGGEWISSIAIENAVSAHPKAAMVCVIGMPHPKWGERPMLVVKLRDDAEADPNEFLEHLSSRIARWWMPDEVRFVDAIPIGATGKIDKKGVRAALLGGERRDGILPVAQSLNQPQQMGTPA